MNRRDPTIPYEEASLYKSIKMSPSNEARMRRVKIGKKKDENLKGKSIKVDSKQLRAEPKSPKVDSKQLRAEPKSPKVDSKQLRAEPKSPSEKKQLSADEKEYRVAFNHLKKHHQLSELRHGHQMIMDQKQGNDRVMISQKFSQDLIKLEKIAISRST